MSRVVWLFAVLVPVAVGVLGLRWALADFLLDRFGSLPDSLTGGRTRQVSASVSDRSDPSPSSSTPEAIEP